MAPTVGALHVLVHRARLVGALFGSGIEIFRFVGLFWRFFSGGLWCGRCVFRGMGLARGAAGMALLRLVQCARHFKI